MIGGRRGDMPRRVRRRRKYLLWGLTAASVALILLATLPLTRPPPESEIWLVGLSSSGLRAVDADSWNPVYPPFVSQIPAAYRYSFAAGGGYLYVGLSYGGAKVYRVNLKSGALDVLTVADAGDLRDLVLDGQDLYALVLDYSSKALLLTRIDVGGFRVAQSLHLESFLGGTPYRMLILSNMVYLVTYDSSSSTSRLAYVNPRDVNDHLVVQVPIPAVTKLSTDGARIYVRGSDSIAAYTTQLEYVGRVDNVYGYGDILCFGGRIYVAGSSPSWSPAVHVIRGDLSLERTIVLSSSSGAALNLATKGSAVYAAAFSSGVGCFIIEVSEVSPGQFLLPNTEDEFPTALYLLRGGGAF